MYAGQNGANDFQGDPPRAKWSPRVGVVYSLDSKTVLRGGYGIYWAPWNFQQPSTGTNNYGQTGLHAEHADAAEPVHPDGDARQPVPERSGPAGG